ncbi:hypothetical protein Cgig2_029789 [Carnegiea gigantea]|uniref:Uncharacterized protein n=1 Tax=Carnegiea gigantea TaxID=171969 RepID=A0A9Q1KL98_9CARY|nr:hypothetical protein Cgig2_029789 [Carnegiea gigantea]
MVFDGHEGPHFTSPYNDPLVVELKVASAIVCQIWIDTGSSKLKHLGRDIIPLIHPILGFKEQEVNPTGIIHLPVHFGNKAKARNLELDQLQIKANDGSIDKSQGDQRTAQECYLVSIRPLVEHSIKCRPAGPPRSDKKQRIVPPSPAEHTLALADPEQPRPEAVDGIEEIPLEKGTIIPRIWHSSNLRKYYHW